METYAYRTASDVVKDEGDNRFSRDDNVLASGSGVVLLGTVLGEITATPGKFKPLAPAATDGTQNAAAIILQSADATSADVVVVNLKRRAQVVRQALIWPPGITAAQQAAAERQLAGLQIIMRNGV